MMNIFQSQMGISLESFQDKEISTGIFKNGIFKKVSMPMGVFTYKFATIPDNLGLTKECSFDFERNESIPKIPGTVFDAILKLYRDVSKEIKSEVYSLVVWDKEKQDFFIHVPEQTVAGASVNYVRDPAVFSNPNYVLYLESHSHVNMNAFFSGTDVADEVAGRYFAVLGKIDSELPELALKVAFNKEFKYCKYEEVFDDEVSQLHSNSNYEIDYENVRPLITERATYYSTPAVSKSTTASKPYDYSYGSTYTGKTTYTFFQLYRDTIFEKGEYDLTTFNYDFKHLFSNRSLNINLDQSINNLYQSLTTMIIDNTPAYGNLDHLSDIIYDAVDGVISTYQTINDLNSDVPSTNEDEVDLFLEALHPND